MPGPLPAVPSVVRIALKHLSTDGQQLLTRFFARYSNPAPPSAAQLNQFAQDVGTRWNAILAPLVNPDNSLVEVDVVDLTSPVGATGTSVTPHPGTRAGDALAAQVAFIIQYRIARRYRGGHPRGYWPFGSFSDLAGPGAWTNGFQAACLTGYNNFFGGILADWNAGIGGTIFQVNVSYFTGSNPVTYPSGRVHNVPIRRVVPVVDVVVSIHANPKLGTQRRRIGQGA